MARRKTEEKNIRKLSRVGSGKTYSITLPIEAIRKLNWKEGQKVVVEFDERNKLFRIKDWKK